MVPSPLPNAIDAMRVFEQPGSKRREEPPAHTCSTTEGGQEKQNQNMAAQLPNNLLVGFLLVILQSSIGQILSTLDTHLANHCIFLKSSGSLNGVPLKPLVVIYVFCLGGRHPVT